LVSNIQMNSILHCDFYPNGACWSCRWIKHCPLSYSQYDTRQCVTIPGTQHYRYIPLACVKQLMHCNSFAKDKPSSTFDEPTIQQVYTKCKKDKKTNKPEACQRVATINSHRAWTTDALATRTAKCQRWIDLVLDLNECIENHRTTIIEINVVGLHVWLISWLVWILQNQSSGNEITESCQCYC